MTTKLAEGEAEKLHALWGEPLHDVPGVEPSDSLGGDLRVAGVGPLLPDDPSVGEDVPLRTAQTGRFFGYVLGSAEPVGVLAEFLAAALNQNVTSWRSGPAATTIERALVSGLAGELGCDGFSGSSAGRGSSANLMGLAMARESRCPPNESGARPGVVYASSEAHMSIPKAVALLGLGRENLRLLSVDARFKMSTDALRAAIADDLAVGRTPMAVVATAGTTSTGAVDPLEDIADVAREHGVRLPKELARLAIGDRGAPAGWSFHAHALAAARRVLSRLSARVRRHGPGGHSRGRRESGRTRARPSPRARPRSCAAAMAGRRLPSQGRSRCSLGYSSAFVAELKVQAAHRLCAARLGSKGSPSVRGLR